MLAFIIPFKPKRETTDWRNDNLLLERTVNCLLNQTNKNFKIFIIYTDIPEFNIIDERVQLEKTPFPFLEFDYIDNKEEILIQHKDKKVIERSLDKGKKITFGSALAKKDGCNYIMSVDSDDLISNKIVDFVERTNLNNSAPGWYVTKGYVMRNNRNWLVKNFHMNSFNGSTHILRSDLVAIPDFSSTKWHDYSLFTAHGWITYRVKEYANEEIIPVPFFAVIYVAHTNNLSEIYSITSVKSLKNMIKKTLYGTRINKKLKEEFSITKI